jgi:hypothetical protein
MRAAARTSSSEHVVLADTFQFTCFSRTKLLAVLVQKYSFSHSVCTRPLRARAAVSLVRSLLAVLVQKYK